MPQEAPTAGKQENSREKNKVSGAEVELGRGGRKVRNLSDRDTPAEDDEMDEM